MLEQVLDQIGDFEILIAGTALILFAASYAFFFNWRKTAAGRALMYFALSIIALFIDDTFSSAFGPNYSWRNYYQFGVYTGIMLATIRLQWVLWREWTHTRKIEIERKLDGNGSDEPQDAD